MMLKMYWVFIQNVFIVLNCAAILAKTLKNIYTDRYTETTDMVDMIWVILHLFANLK